MAEEGTKGNGKRKVEKGKEDVKNEEHRKGRKEGNGTGRSICSEKRRER